MRDPRQVEVVPVCHPRGCRSYVVVDPGSRDALIVDPLLDHVKEILEVLSVKHAVPRWIVDTHSHGDHLSGAAALKERLGCDVVMHPAAASEVATVRADDGAVLPFGETGLKVWHAPGNSPDALVIEAPGVFFTGDVMLIGSMGLKDVPGGDPKRHFETLHRLFHGRPETTVVHPGHDDMGRHTSTLKAERRGNRWLREEDFEVFRQRWETDPRQVSKEASEFLEANRQGVTRVPKHLESAVGLLDAARATEARIRGETRIEAAAQDAGAPRPAVQSGLAALMTACGAGAVAGWLLGVLILPAFHALSLVCGAVMLAVGLFGGENRRRKKGGGDDGLYYQGPARHKLTS
jgi:glyoxylase-like metal-dependent hydrolase (beta-lactamase superfamily II)